VRLLRCAATLLGIAALAATSACTSLPQAPPRPTELAAVPFFPQEQYQCGPAALATVLTYAGVATTPEALLPDVYIPARQGSLQADLIGAARRHGRVPWLLDGSPDELDAQLDEGRPVLVLQNFGSRSRPLWHYAVVVGREADGAYLLRSGVTQRQRLPARRFLATWARGDTWALVLLRPGEVPANATPRRYADAVAGLLAAGRTAESLAAVQSGTTRWPDDTTLLLARSEAELAGSDARAAERSLAEVLKRAPGDVAARNNYALLLARRGCRTAAAAEIARATDGARDTTFAAEVARSAAEIASTPVAGGGEGCPAP
jgi:hypothetical protein